MSHEVKQEIVISAAGWQNAEDFYAEFLVAMGAPPWHGHNLDALWDSMRGGINQVNPPYRLRITEGDQSSEESKQFLRRFEALVQEARASGVEVDLVFEPAL